MFKLVSSVLLLAVVGVALPNESSAQRRYRDDDRDRYYRNDGYWNRYWNWYDDSYRPYYHRRYRYYDDDDGYRYRYGYRDPYSRRYYGRSWDRDGYYGYRRWRDRRWWDDDDERYYLRIGPLRFGWQ